MADSTIPNLPQANSLNATDVTVVDQSGTTKKSLLSTLADWILKTYTGFVQSGSGAVAIPLQTHDRAFPTTVDYGLAGDGTDESTKLSNFCNAGGGWVTGNTFTCGSRVAIPANTFLYGRPNAKFKCNAAASGGDFSITGGNVIIRDLGFIGSDQNSGQVLFFNGTSISSVLLDHVSVTTTIGGANNQTAIQISSATPSKIKILNPEITSSSYGILVNSGSTNGTDIEIIGGSISSDKASAIVINAPGITIGDIRVVGTTLTGAPNGSGTGDNMAFEVAGGNNITFTANTVISSKLEAVHIEDAQKRVVISSNTLNNCANDGIHVTNANSPHGPVITDNHIYSAASAANTIGIYLVNDANGTTNGAVVNSNRIYGFPIGMNLGASAVTSCEGNVVENCTTAYKVDGPGGTGGFQGCGTNYVKGPVTTLVSITYEGTFGKVISDTNPTNILVHGSATNTPVVMLGFAFPSPSFNNTGSGVLEYATVFPVATRMNGKIVIYFNFAGLNSDTGWYSADVLWDGTTLTKTNVLTRLSGAIAAVDVRVNTGNFQFGVQVAAARNGIIAHINFDGQYVQA